jgi:hypothetical protein
MGRITILLVVAFFPSTVVTWGQKEERVPLIVCEHKLCVLPPIIGIVPESKPAMSFIKNLQEFHRFYIESLREKFLTSDKPENLWWAVVLLRPECGKEEWCIEVDIAEEKKGARPILVTRILLLERGNFDAGTEAEKAAEKTKAVIFPAQKPQKISCKSFI